MRNDERLAATQHHIRNVVENDLVNDAHGFTGIEFIAQPLARCRFGAAMKAAKIAIARDLPRHEQRCAQRIDHLRGH